MVGIAVTVYTVDANCRIPLVSETFGRASMSDLDDLIAAAKQGYLQRVNAILEADNSLVNQKDESGATPVHYAALNGHSHIVRLPVQRRNPPLGSDFLACSLQERLHVSNSVGRLGVSAA